MHQEKGTSAMRIVVAIITALTLVAAEGMAKDIVHDAEHYLLEAQHSEKWSSEDEAIDAKLRELEKRAGTRPNIIHIMWDDTAVGEVGIPEIQSVRGFSTPNMNKMADDGINFMRMYTEPACTPTRAAFQTGRYAVRSGMHTVAFPVEYSGMDRDEVTIAEVLSKAGYMTGFFGKWHLGDTEFSPTTRAMTRRSSRPTTRFRACGCPKPKR
jgi:arylsulfatase